MGVERYAYMRAGGELVYVHRHVMEQHLGRKLDTSEHVHHRNGNKRDNRLENLEVISAADHARLHGRTWRENLWADRTCHGCGCDHDERKRGCHHCTDRHLKRKYAGMPYVDRWAAA